MDFLVGQIAQAGMRRGTPLRRLKADKRKSIGNSDVLWKWGRIKSSEGPRLVE
jgi:hypothetical protein